MKPPFDLVVWDFDGVLNANIVDGRFVWADRIEKDLGLDPESFQEFVFRSGLIKDVVNGRFDIVDVVADWLRSQRETIGAQDFVDYWFRHDALPDHEVTGWLKAYSGRSVIGTNNETRRASYIEGEMKYGPLVEHVFASGRMKVAKPEARFFTEIMDWAGASVESILLIDDHGPNVEAAIALGWQGFHFTPKTRDELPNMLGLLK